MSDLASRGGLASCQRRSQEAGGNSTFGEAVEGGEEGTVDGQSEGAGLGQEWQMPLPLLKLKHQEK